MSYFYLQYICIYIVFFHIIFYENNCLALPTVIAVIVGVDSHASSSLKLFLDTVYKL